MEDNLTQHSNQASTVSFSTSEIEATIVLAHKKKDDRNLFGDDMREQPDDCGFKERFQLLSEFAAGGVGCVSKAKDLSFDRIVAVKSLNTDHCDDPQAIRAFIDECLLNARLDHPSIVPIYALGKGEDGHWEAAMKFINGSSLRNFIAETRKRYDNKKINAIQERHALISRLEYFLKICEVIEYCHSLKIVHGDLKPDNILMGQFGEVYVLDWGCAQRIGNKPERISGTPNYLPPEFFSNKTITTQIDIFALGMILFELTTLLRGNSRCSNSMTEINNTCCLVSDPGNYRHYKSNLSISTRLRAIVLKAVNQDPAKRYASVAELSADIRHFIYDEEVTAAPDNLLQKMFRIVYRNRLKSITIAALLLALPIAGWYYSSYCAMKREQQFNQDTLQRLRLQSYTDILSTATAKRFLMAQGKLLLFADNLLDSNRLRPGYFLHRYENKDYALPPQAPTDLQKVPLYAQPVTFNQMVYIPAPPQLTVQTQNLPHAAQFVEICRKALNYNLDSSQINLPLLYRRSGYDPDKQLHRLFVLWKNGDVYSYPGTYEDPSTPQFKRRFVEKESHATDSHLRWTAPYQGLSGTHRIQCEYPMFDQKNEYIGLARIEVRLEQLLSPLLKANLTDPVHELFFMSPDGSVVQVSGGKLEVLPQKSSNPERLTAATLQQVLAKLKENHMQQTTILLNKRLYYVSASTIHTVNGILIQMIEESNLKSHNHVDLSV